MTYTTGQKIQASDYNTIGWTNPSIGGHWGVGTGNHGLGQSTSGIAQLSASPPTKVTAVQWSTLMSTINTCLLHHGQTPISVAPSTITVGQKIKAFSQLVTGSALAYNSAGSTTYLADGAANNLVYSSAWGQTGNRALAFAQTVTFATGDAARYFFNAGGKIKVAFSRAGGSTNPQNTSWSNLCSNSGTITFGYNNTTKVGGAGTINSILNSGNGGYWSGTTSFITHFKQFDSASGGAYYATDYLRVDFRWSGTPSNGGYPVLEITTSMVNTSGALLTGNFTTSLVVTSPTTTAGLVNSWGNPVVGGSVAPN
jgi:hypothetical protein